MSFSRVYLSGSKSDPDRIYYNATIASNTLPSANNVLQNSVPLTFGESRQTPLVVDASRYEMQVENVTLSGVTKTLPLLIPTIASPSTDVQTTIYTVYVNVFDGTNYKQGSAPVVWFPSDPYLVVPGLGTYQTDSAYYYNYEYDHWVKLMNNALNAAWLSAGGSVSFGTKCPFFQYDETTGFFNLNQDCYTSLTPIGTALPSPYNVAPVPVAPTPISPLTGFTNGSPTAGQITFTFAAQTSAPYTPGQEVTFTSVTGLPSGPYVVSACTTTSVTIYSSATVTSVAGSSVSLYYVAYAKGEYSFVGMNKQLFQLMSNFNIIANPDGKVWGGGLNYPEIVFDMGLTLNSNIVNGSTPANGLGTGLKNYPTVTTYPIINPFTAAAIQPYARLTQNFVSTSNWSPVSSIVVGTTKIPVRNEDESGVYKFGTSNVGIENGASSNFFKLLIEFPVPMQTAELTRQFILYQPLTPTFSAMDDSHVDIHDVDFQFYWRNNRTGQLNPLKIDTGSSATVRLCFEKKK